MCALQELGKSVRRPGSSSNIIRQAQQRIAAAGAEAGPQLDIRTPLQVRDPHTMHYPPKQWPRSPRIVV